MSRAGPTALPRGATGRADLLRALAVAPRDRLALDDDGETWFGYVRRLERAAEPAGTEPIRAPRPAPAAVPERRLPLRMPFVQTIVLREPREAPEPSTEAEHAVAHARPVDEASTRAPSPVRLVGYEDLVPQARLLPALRRLVGSTRPGPLDLERLTQRLAAGELPRHLPRRRLRRWHPDLVVLLDFSPRLWPYREDMHRLAEWLLGHCGRSGVQLRIVNHDPFGPWGDWLAHQDPRSRTGPRERPWAMPAAGTAVLIASDLGLLLGAGSGPGRAWQRFIESLRRAQIRPLALVPLGARQIDAAQAVPMLRWSPDAPARLFRARGPALTEPEGLDDLLAMVAATRRVDPPLLRALRRLISRGPLDAGLEGALWCHADVEAGASASIRREARARHLGHFARCLPRLQGKLHTLRARHHAHLRACLNHEEALLWGSHADPAVVQTYVQDIEAARVFLRRLAATLTEPGGPCPDAWWHVARGIEQRADAEMARRHADLLTPLVAARLRWALARGLDPAVPEWADPAELAGLLDDDLGPVECWLVRDAATCSLLLQAEPAGPRQSPLGEPLLLDAGGAQVRVGEGDRVARRWVGAGDLPVPLAGLHEPVLVLLETAREAVTVAAVRRPPGALGWACDASGIALSSAPLAGQGMRWRGQDLRGVRLPPGHDAAFSWALEADDADPSQAGGTFELGVDAHYGVHADLTITTGHGSARQRLRWIEPGTFWMGSPEEEPERDKDEGPRHVVTLTRGFWLGDSACTQALWQAVTGSKPSRFADDPQRPVEGVSWFDVEGFLRRLESLVPGCEAVLPTEAQWEYACRAGTDTPFSFGPQISPEQVNYDGSLPYAGGEKGLYREQTVPVKSLPPNAWGLYEMHGNVWEWCADGLREYDDEDQEDPWGPVLEAEETPRAVRGGSWFREAGWARSALRLAGPPGCRFRSPYLGFRLCLRSIEPGQGPDRPGGPAGASPGGRSRVSSPTRHESGTSRGLGEPASERLHGGRKTRS